MKRTLLFFSLFFSAVFIACVCAGTDPENGLESIQAAGQVSTPAGNITLEEELRIGREVAARIAGRYGIVDNTQLTEYVTLVGLLAAANSERPNLPYRFAVLDSDEVNAHAAPGGYIFITMGALRESENEAELAGILSHEIAHVTGRHILLELGMAAQGSSGNPSARAPGKIPREMPGSVADRGAGIIFRGHSTRYEYDADAAGTRTLERSGYPADGLLTFLERMSQESTNSGFLPLLTNYPEATDRVIRLRKVIRDGNFSIDGRPRLRRRFREIAG